MSTGAPKPLYRHRFAVAYAVLAAVAGLGIGGSVLLLGREPEPTLRWSAWAPSAEDGGDRIREIVDHVTARYRLSSGRELVDVFAQAGRVQNVRLEEIEVRSPVVVSDDDVSRVEGSKTLVFLLCDVGGETCSVPPGVDTQQRLRLVRHQALELALYTFKYVDGVNSVVAFLPRVGEEQQATPAPDGTDTGAAPAAALFFEREDLEPQLEQPLRLTLRRPTARLTPAEEPPAGQVLDRLTLPRIYRYNVEQGQEGAILILDPATIES